MTNQRRHPCCRGFTYIELVTSLAISSILLLSLSSVILIGSKAIPTGTEQIHAEAALMKAIDLLTSDIELATGLSSVTGVSFTVKVPDRDGDAAADAINYAFDVDTKTLYKQWNADARQVLLENVNDMSVDFDINNARASSVIIELTVTNIANEVQIVQVDLFNVPEVR